MNCTATSTSTSSSLYCLFIEFAIKLIKGKIESVRSTEHVIPTTFAWACMEWAWIGLWLYTPLGLVWKYVDPGNKYTRGAESRDGLKLHVDMAVDPSDPLTVTEHYLINTGSKHLPYWRREDLAPHASLSSISHALTVPADVNLIAEWTMMRLRSSGSSGISLIHQPLTDFMWKTLSSSQTNHVG